MDLSKDKIQELLQLTVGERKDWVQRDALRVWNETGCKGAEVLATGVGKTRLAILAIEEELKRNSKAIIHIAVPTTTLRDDDWPAEFINWKCGHLLSKVKIFCHTSMDKIKSKTEEVDLFVFDECHHFTSKMSAYFGTNKVWKTLGLSATLPDGTRDEEDMERKTLIDKYCPEIYKVSLEEAIALELVADFEVKVLLFHLDDVKLYNFGTEKKRIMRTEKQHYAKLSSALGQAMFNKKLAGLKFKRMQERRDFLVNSQSKFRLAKVVKDQMLEKGKRTLIFCGSIDQANTLFGTNVYHSKTNDESLKAFQAFQTDYIAAVNALDEGKNLKDLDQLLIIQGTSVKRTVVQRYGRALRIRPNHKALIAMLVAKGTADEKWYRLATSDLCKSRITEYIVKLPEI